MAEGEPLNDGLPVFAALLAAMEAGVPVPVPSDVLLLVLGERASAGSFPLLLVIVALELVAAVGTATLFFLVRGPGRAVLQRFGPRLGSRPSGSSGRPAWSIAAARPPWWSDEPRPACAR